MPGWFGLCLSLRRESIRTNHSQQRNLGVPKPGCFKPGCLQLLRGSALLRPFALFCGLAFALFLCSFERICAHLRVSATAFTTTAFGNCRKTRNFLDLGRFARVGFSSRSAMLPKTGFQNTASPQGPLFCYDIESAIRNQGVQNFSRFDSRECFANKSIRANSVN